MTERVFQILIAALNEAYNSRRITEEEYLETAAVLNRNKYV